MRAHGIVFELVVALASGIGAATAQTSLEPPVGAPAVELCVKNRMHYTGSRKLTYRIYIKLGVASGGNHGATPTEKGLPSLPTLCENITE